MNINNLEPEVETFALCVLLERAQRSMGGQAVTISELDRRCLERHYPHGAGIIVTPIGETSFTIQLVAMKPDAESLLEELELANELSVLLGRPIDTSEIEDAIFDRD